MQSQQQTSDLPFRVRYFDAEASKSGRGVQIRRFATAEEAEAFAVGRTLYGKPAVAEWRLP